MNGIEALRNVRRNRAGRDSADRRLRGLRVFSVNGKDGGYAAGCCDCPHPMMSNFKAREAGDAA